jgi:tryptophan-rich sensory protein
VLTAAVCALAVAGLGALVTDLGPWYQSLRQPAWKPPDVLFGPAWTLIFALTALAGVVAWRQASGPRPRGRMLALFAVNALLNVLWSAMFFRLHRPDWAFVEVLLLWLSIVCLLAMLAPISKTAAWLLVPYLVWVTFAGALNLAVVRLNYPFGPV